MASHPQVPHPHDLLPGGSRGTAALNDRLLSWLGSHILASRMMANAALILPLLVLPMSASVKITLGVISGSWIQWWALPILQRSANEADAKREAKADADHQALTSIHQAVDEIKAALAVGKEQM